MMVRLRADIFVKHLIALNFINSCLFNTFSVNTTEDELEGAVTKSYEWHRVEENLKPNS